MFKQAINDRLLFNVMNYGTMVATEICINIPDPRLKSKNVHAFIKFENGLTIGATINQRYQKTFIREANEVIGRELPVTTQTVNHSYKH